MSDRTLRTIEVLVVATLFAVAFGILDLSGANSTQAPFEARLEGWFFDASGSSAGLVAAIAAWMTWRRLPALARATPPASSPFGLGRIARTTVPVALCVGVAFWSSLNEARDLLFISAALLLGSYGVFCAGGRGLRLMGMPMLTLLFALPIPFPLRNELVWTLQNWSAAGTAWTLDLVGVEFVRSGAHLAYGEIFFLVIEGCSGLRSILTLTLVALVLRELMGDKSLASWVPVFLAPALAMFLNIVRIATIILGSSGQEPELDSAHLGQGLIVLAVGSVLLFFLAHWLARPPADPAADSKFDLRSLPLWPVAAVLLVLCVIRFSVDPWPLPVFEGQTRIHLDPAEATSSQARAMIENAPTPIQFPLKRRRWIAEPAELDFAFIGVMPRGSIERRLYRRNEPLFELGDRAVELLIATSSSGDPRANPFSSKLVLPGRRWQLKETELVKDYVLDEEISVSRVTAPDEAGLVFSWMIRSEGFWRETARSLFAIERGPFARSKPRVFVQIATRLGLDDEGFVKSKRILNRFVSDFRKAFRAL